MPLEYPLGNEEPQPVKPRADSPQIHVSSIANAVNFLALVGTAVLAAEDGVVVYVKDDAPDIPVTEDEYWRAVESGAEALTDLVMNRTNMVVLEHVDGTYTEYLYLQRGSAWLRSDDGDVLKKLELGDEIEKGKQFARVGMAGITDRPQLHFNRFRLLEDAGRRRSESIRFRMRQTVNREVGRTLIELWDI